MILLREGAMAHSAMSSSDERSKKIAKRNLGDLETPSSGCQDHVFAPNTWAECPLLANYRETYPYIYFVQAGGLSPPYSGQRDRRRRVSEKGARFSRGKAESEIGANESLRAGLLRCP
jgi:hypothetical protein